MDYSDKQIQCNALLTEKPSKVRGSDQVFLTRLLSPFYGEDFYCEIPRSFRHLSFYIFDRDVFRRDSSIGE